MDFDETIIAQASAKGAAARGILRLSGTGSLRALQGIFEPYFYGAASSRIVDGSVFPWDRQTPVPATLYFWPKGHGYTGEESVEIHTVGSQPIVDAILASVLRNENSRFVRLARPGEFTMRAFLAGRLDLTQAEAVLGVIDAKSTTALETALDQLAGGVAISMRKLRQELLEMLAHLEAGFDFGDEDIEFVSKNELRSQLESALVQTEAMERKMQGRRLSTEKPRIVLFGPPNAGKTTLFNRLLGSERGIVSPVPGTTRDYLEAAWTPSATNISKTAEGLSCVLIDTAGTDDVFGDSPDLAAQQFANSVVDAADLIIFCLEKGTELIEREKRFIETNAERLILYRTKETNDLDSLRNEINGRLHEKFYACDVVESTAVRCRESLSRAANSLRTGLNLLATISDESLVAAEIRVALDALGAVVGEVHTDDLLDMIFSRFCIGK